MALNRIHLIIFWPIRSRPDRNILSSTKNYPVSDYNKPVNTTRNEAITSYNMLIIVLYFLYLLRLGMRGMVNSTLFLKFSEKIYDTPVKNSPTWIRPKSLSPTRAKNILKNVSRSQTGLDPVHSGPGKFGFSVALQVFNSHNVLLYLCRTCCATENTGHFLLFS